MRIVVRSSELQKGEWLGKPAKTGVDLHFIDADEHLSETGADAYFDLLFDENNGQLPNTNKPIFVNAVTALLNELPGNCIRINAWNGFLSRDIVEIVAAATNKPAAAEIMHTLGWQYIFVPDIRGMIVARNISMIINEAYYALGDKVSSKVEMDIAMKLGTNYPFGPFEWSEKIGLKNIYHLLKMLSVEDDHYIAASYLEQDLTKNSI
ncbi:hypothetical protein BH10BAC2_BH10BAC2_29080 [soil metagenome]